MRRQAAILMAALMMALLVALAPVHVQTHVTETPAAFGEALKSWAAAHKIAQAFVVVRHGGRVVHRYAVGAVDPRAPLHIASLSKAITGACIAALVRDGKLAFDFAGAGDDNDPASGRNLDRYLKTHTARAPPKPALLAAVLKAKLVRAPGSQYAYSNASYFLLGAIIEEASGRAYPDTCRDAVLMPLGVAGEIEPSWRVSPADGGWRMTAEDYLTVLDLFDANDHRLGAAAKAWMLEPEGKTVAPGGKIWYGLGTRVRQADSGVTVWHSGFLDYWPDKTDRDAVRANFAVHATRLSDGTS